MAIELLVASEDGTVLYQPVTEEGITWKTSRRGSPGKLKFSFIDDGEAGFSEGSAVRLTVDGDKVFYGFVFTRKGDKGPIVEVTAYDQLRYFQNKDTYVYENKTASQVVSMLADDYSLNLGTVEDTEFIIASRVEENTSLFDIAENALDLELTNKGEMFVLYDDFGKLMLKNISSMYVGSESEGYLCIDEETGEDYEYTFSIDSETYNRIKLTYDNEDTGTRDIYIAQDSSNINKWGILQYFDTLSDDENGQSKADALLTLYNSKTRNLKMRGVLGDNRVRAGSMVLVNLKIGDMELKNFMLVEECEHTYRQGLHSMDLTLRGGEFVA